MSKADILSIDKPEKGPSLMSENSPGRDATTPLGSLGRWLPLIAVLAVAGMVVAMGWQKYLSFKTIGLNYEALRGFIGQNLLGALGLYVLAYVAVVALSLPGALIMTLTGGLLFGWQLGAPATVIGDLFISASPCADPAAGARCGRPRGRAPRRSPSRRRSWWCRPRCAAAPSGGS